MLWANLHLLFWLSLMPFVTAWMGENHFAAIPVALYGVDLLAAAIAYYILARTLIAVNGKDSPIAIAVGRDIKGKISPLIYLAAIVASFFYAPVVARPLLRRRGHVARARPAHRARRPRKMTAREILVPVEDKADLAAMLRDYIAEMATIIPGVDPEQPYPYFDLYWTEPDSRWPFWLKVDDANAGFALLAATPEPCGSPSSSSPVRIGVRGIGQAAARRLIARFPGPWQITQREANSGGIAFWHRVLDGFVTYDETTTQTDAVRREQRFTYP